MIKVCAICKNRDNLHSIKVPFDYTDSGVMEYETKLCSKCWDVIAEIAHLALESKIESLENRIKILEQR
jgi:hypothetical protein